MLVSCREPLEDIGAERRRRGEADPRHVSCGRRARAAPEGRHGCTPRLVRRAVEHEHAVEMVELVLADAGVEAFELEPEVGAACGSFAVTVTRRVPLDRHEEALEREAALVVDVGLVAARRDRGVDDGDRRVARSPGG